MSKLRENTLHRIARSSH